MTNHPRPGARPEGKASQRLALRGDGGARNRGRTPGARNLKPDSNWQAGFSLIELMVSITLGLMVLGALATVFSDTSRARAELQRSSEQIDNGRYAIGVLSEDLRLAGYYGELNVAALMVPGALPDLCSNDPADWLAAIPLHVQGFDEGAGAPSCVPASLKSGTDVLAVRRVRTCTAGSAGCDAVAAAQPYLQVALCGSAAGSHALGIASDTVFSLMLKDCVTPAGLRRYTVHIYFVSSDNGSGRSIPTLKRLEFTGAGYSEVPLVEGIERLQVEYGLDTNGDGSPDFYTADPTGFTHGGCPSCNPVNNWANVVTAKLHVLSRTLEPSPGHLDSKIYALGADANGAPVAVGPFNDSYRRHVYSAAVRLMNPSGRRDTP